MQLIDLNEQLWENLSQWPERVRYYVVGLIAAAFLGISYWFSLRTDFIEYNKLLNQQLSLKREFETKQQSADLLSFQRQLQTLSEEFSLISKRLANKNEIANLLDDIARAGGSCGLNFELFAPKAEERQEFFIATPISIIVTGQYQQLTTFLNQLVEIDRLVSIEDFELKEKIDDKEGLRSESDTDNLLLMKITARIYRHRD